MALHLFNLGGYYLLFHYYVNRSENQLVTRLDKNAYNEKELVEIKIPFQVPYLSGPDKYERVDGELVINGIYYSYAKRKFSKDTLYLMCLPNHGKTQVLTARAEFSKAINGLNNGSGKEKPIEKKINFVNEFYQTAILYNIKLNDSSESVFSFCTDSSLVHSHIDNIYKPPKA